MSERLDFVTLAAAPGANIRRLCRRFGISPATAYKWIARARDAGPDALADRSRRPARSPSRTPEAVEAEVLALRECHPAWGGRKLHRRLLDLGHPDVPSPSTITEILRRAGRLEPEASQARQRWQRFEHEEPNALWQMDFKGEFALARGACYPLTVLDDHSRYALGLVACSSVRGASTRVALEAIFGRYGLPARMTMDNGAPWRHMAAGRGHYTAFAVWLMRLGVRVSHSRPYHPQTQGKDERFHRSLGQEVLRGRTWTRLGECQVAFDRWRKVYNHERPHEALGLEVPATRYRESPRPLPEQLPEIEYPSGDQVRIVQRRGQIKVSQQRFFIGTALAGLPVGVRPTTTDGRFEVYFCHQRLATIDLRSGGLEY